jgi:hypothetical protein
MKAMLKAKVKMKMTRGPACPVLGDPLLDLGDLPALEEVVALLDGVVEHRPVLLPLLPDVAQRLLKLLPLLTDHTAATAGMLDIRVMVCAARSGLIIIVIMMMMIGVKMNRVCTSLSSFLGSAVGARELP